MCRPSSLGVRSCLVNTQIFIKKQFSSDRWLSLFMHRVILDQKREVGGPGPDIDMDNNYPGVFAYSPPGLNHTVTFNATLLALLSDGFVQNPHCGRPISAFLMFITSGINFLCVCAIYTACVLFIISQSILRVKCR